MVAISRLSPARKRICTLFFTAVLLIGGFPQAAAAESEEACLTASINGARQEHESRRLSTDSRLVTIARRHSARMAQDQRYYHNANLRNELPSGWRSEGENVGWATDCGYMHNFFMNSPAHRKNILSAAFNQIGVGVVKDSAGKLWVTQVFMESSGRGGLSQEPGPALSAPPPEAATPPSKKDAPEPPADAESKGGKTAKVSAGSPASRSPAAQSIRSPSQPQSPRGQTTPDVSGSAAVAAADTQRTVRLFGWEGSSSDLAPILFDLER